MSDVNWGRVLMEAIIAGIIVLVVGLIINWISSSMRGDRLASLGGLEFRMGSLGVTLFLTGFFVYLVGRYAGTNKYFCTGRSEM